MQIYLNDITDDLRLFLNLESSASPSGTYINPATEQTSKLDNLLLSREPAPNNEPISWIINGTTDSKLYAIINTIKNQVIKDKTLTQSVGSVGGGTEIIQNFNPKNFLNIPIKISGTDITATISVYETNIKEYSLYSDTDFPIKYIDFSNGTTTFMFSKIAEDSRIESPLLIKYPGLIEEPKVESSLFIERGIVNVFEPFTKLKKIKSLNELTKFGFGYYKINKEGFNF